MSCQACTRRRARDVLFERMHHAANCARDKVARVGLVDNVAFRLCDSDDDAASFVRSIGITRVPFYVGITSDVAWRWLGGYKDDGEYMTGHSKTWSQMVVIAQRLGSSAGCQLEMFLIRVARQEFPRTCANKKAGGAGVSVSCDTTFFLYICSQPGEVGVSDGVVARSGDSWPSLC